MRWHDDGLQGLTYDDILIRPQYSELASRSDPEIIKQFSIHDRPYDYLSIPIIAANMSTIATEEMAKALAAQQIIVPIHRFQDIASERTVLQNIAAHAYLLSDMSHFTPLAATVGLNDRDRAIAISEYCIVFFLELAHADSSNAISELKWLRTTFPSHLIVAGNVATADACKRLFNAGADIVKVGIGPGSVCTTRLVTGCGVPQLSAILECAPTGPIIADGGIRHSGDIVKALAAGAEFVMIGSLFAGCDECGDNVYSGMASREAGKVRNGCIPEGVSTVVPYAGPAYKVAENLIAGIKQGMSMVGARNIKELREKAVFQRVSPATLEENRPHILNRR